MDNQEIDLDLVTKAKKGDIRSRQALVEKYVPLIKKVACQVSSKRRGIEDMISEGAIAIDRCIDQYDRERNTRFSTFAYWYVWGYLMRIILREPLEGQLQLSIHIQEDRQKLFKVADRMEIELGRQPTQEELAKELGWAEGRVGTTLWAEHISRVDQIDKRAWRNGILSEPLDVIPDGEPLMETVILSRCIVEEAMSRLTEREKRCLRMASEGYTLKEIGQSFSPTLTGERVRQIIRSAAKVILPELIPNSRTGRKSGQMNGAYTR